MVLRPMAQRQRMQANDHPTKTREPIRRRAGPRSTHSKAMWRAAVNHSSKRVAGLSSNSSSNRVGPEQGTPAWLNERQAPTGQGPTAVRAVGLALPTVRHHHLRLSENLTRQIRAIAHRRRTIASIQTIRASVPVRLPIFSEVVARAGPTPSQGLPDPRRLPALVLRRAPAPVRRLPTPVQGLGRPRGVREANECRLHRSSKRFLTWSSRVRSKIPRSSFDTFSRLAGSIRPISRRSSPRRSRRCSSRAKTPRSIPNLGTRACCLPSSLDHLADPFHPNRLWKRISLSAKRAIQDNL